MAPIEPDHNAVERQIKQIIQILYEAMIQVNTYDAHTAPPTTNSSSAPLTNGASTPSRLPPPPSSTAQTPNPATTSTSSSNHLPTRDVLAQQLAQLSLALRDIHALGASSAASPSSALASANIPRELITYVENGRNPDIYTREFVELVRRENQLMKGKMGAFADFRDVLAREMASACPELYDDLARVVVNTGGTPPPPPPGRADAGL